MSDEPTKPSHDASQERRPPLDLNYRAPSDDSPPRGRFRFWHGMLLGFVLPAFWWFSGINTYMHLRRGLGAFGGMVVLAVMELVVALVAIFLPKWRRFGIGLLLSVPLLALMFLGTCWAIFAFH